MRAVRGLVRRFSISERADVACCGMTVAQAATLETLHGRARACGSATWGAAWASRRAPSAATWSGSRTRGSWPAAPTPTMLGRPGSSLTIAGRRKARSSPLQEEAFAEDVLGAFPPSIGPRFVLRG